MSKKKEKPMQFFLPVGGGIVNHCFPVIEEELLVRDPADALPALLEKALEGRLSARVISRRRDELLREALRTDRAEALPVLMPQRRMDAERFEDLLAYAEDCGSPDCSAWLLEYRHAHYRPEEFTELEQRRLDLELGFAEPDEAELRRIFRLRYVKKGVCICGVRSQRRSFDIPAAIGGKPVAGVDAAAFYDHEPMPRVKRKFAEGAVHEEPQGDTVSLGHAMIRRGFAEEPLRWRVLRREENRTLLLCERAVAVLPYEKEQRDVTWATCALRHWLNEVFLPLSFTPEEQELILPAAVVTPDNRNFGSAGGQPSEDRLFLLSVEEAETMLPDDEARALGKWWWLRTPGFDNSFAATVTPEGAVVRIGSFVDIDDYAVRPAMWVRTD